MLLRWFTLFTFLWGVSCANNTVAPTCYKTPTSSQSKDVNYNLHVAGEPDLFVPGELYTVNLNGLDSGKGPTPFVGFRIWAELDEDSLQVTSKNDNATASSTKLLGVFHSYDAQTQVMEFCEPSVENATAHAKTEIQVIWGAPLRSVEGTCLRISARVDPAEVGVSSWLSHKLCLAPLAPASQSLQPPIVEPCCACDEAKYEVTFEGLWSRNTHPREFPPESARAHFGDMIGASHTAQYRVWQEGRTASSGLKRLADDGATTALEKELKAESEHIRTIIKARGISWQQVASAGTPSTFAVFRVDAKNHLVSLAAKLAPSPDWIVGVSALELCNANCTWTNSITLPLYPYDAGFDNGLSYVTGHRQPTMPPAPVRALRPDWPRDVRSPFFSSSGEMRPFARLRLTRLRLYEKNCDSADKGPAASPAPPQLGSCVTRTWGAWSPCSVSCGPGTQSRQRYYVHPARAVADMCTMQLTEYRKCFGPRRNCRAPSEYEPDPAESTGPCAVSDWSDWSPCEGCGVRARTRHYLAPRAFKKCNVGFRARMIMSQAMPCNAGPCYKPPPKYANATNFDWFYVDNKVGECPVSAWGDWSPCSARCGRGRRLRTRLYLHARGAVQAHITRTLLAGWSARFAEIQDIEPAVENLTHSDPEVQKQVDAHLERCQFTLTQQEALCDGKRCENVTVSPETCTLPMDVGFCRSYVSRWFYHIATNVCEPFGYSGCGGNNNNFKDRDDCLKACEGVTAAMFTTTTSAPETTTKRIKSTPSNSDNEVMQNDAPFPLEFVNCEVGAWLGWSSCVGQCEAAFKINYRRIVRHPSDNGKPCPKLVQVRNCRPSYCRSFQNTHPKEITEDYPEK